MELNKGHFVDNTNSAVLSFINRLLFLGDAQCMYIKTIGKLMAYSVKNVSIISKYIKLMVLLLSLKNLHISSFD